MTHVIVLAGGNSDEREVSLRSGAAVAAALQSEHHVEIIDPADGLAAQLSALQTADVIFPALHGKGGEDGSVQAFFEQHGLRYVGSDSQASALCFDKARYTQLLQQHGILVPGTEVVDMADFQNSRLSKNPYVLKPNDGGSSIDTFIMREVATASTAPILAAFERHQRLLLQELITGTEITVAVLGSESLPVIEIIPPTDQEFDYENKYNGATQELCPPQHLSQAVQQTAQALAVRIHDLTGCRDMSRTDMFVTGDNQLYVLETNTIPGLTEQSLLPKAGAAAGYTMSDLCNSLVRAALSR